MNPLPLSFPEEFEQTTFPEEFEKLLPVIFV